MSEEYWGGANWIYQATITNGVGGAGNHTYAITTGIGDEMEILFGSVFNGDTVARVVKMHVDKCPVARSLKGAIEITTEVEFQ